MTKKYHDLRRMRTTAELRANCEYFNKADKEDEYYYVKHRGRRGKKRLPNAWWDIQIKGHGRGWKTMRKTQYQQADYSKVNLACVISASDYLKFLKLIRYLRENNISYTVENVIEEKESVRYVMTRQEVVGKTPSIGKDGRQRGWKLLYKTIPLDKPEEKKYNYRCVTHRIVKWEIPRYANR